MRTVISFAIFITLLIPSISFADTVNSFVQVQCLKDLNSLKISVFDANGQIAYKNSHEHMEELWEKRNIREIGTMISYTTLNSDNETPYKDSHDTNMTISDHIQTSCALIEKSKNGDMKPRIYDIHIEPYFFNANSNGYCGGGSPTIELTLTDENKTLIDHLRFISECSTYEPYQHNKGMALGSISSVQLNPEDGYINLEGSLDDKYKDSFIFPHTFWLDEDLPITHKKVYGHMKQDE